MWNRTTRNKLDEWLGPETELKRHPIEDRYFHEFMLAVWDERIQCGMNNTPAHAIH